MSAVWRTARAEAAAWVSRLHGPDRTPAMEAAFREWLAASPDNRQEFENVTEVWDIAKLAPTGGMPREGRWPGSSAPRGWALAAMVLLICAVTVFGLYQSWKADGYSTGIGEQRLVRLPDGTRVSLNSSSRLTLTYDESRRGVTLKQGEVFFEVAKDSRRPFVVVAGTHEVTALGTSFVVRHDERQFAVTLVDGKVAISSVVALPSSGRGPGAGVVTLNPGQRIVVAARGEPKLDTPRIETVTAWRRGEVMLEKTPLAEAIEEMNRYDETRLVIDSADIGGLQISGMYRTGDNAGFAQTVAKLYGLRMAKQDNEIRLVGAP